MNAWDQLLAATHPGREVEIGADRWLLIRRSYQQEEAGPEARPNRLTLTVEMVRAGSDADPRRLPPDAPPPTPTERTP